MLSRINIRNYVIVDQLEVELADGMTVLTGETGAGKSILVDALCLALGDRSDASTVRAGSDKAEIAVEFEISTMPLVQDWLRNNDLNEDEDSVQLRRIITAEGRSRGYINGRKVTMQQLRVLGENLVDIHGQHEHQSLMRKNHQRVLLDAYGQAQDLVAATASAHTIWRDLSQRAETLSQSIQERDERLDFLRFQVQELEVLELDQDSVDRLEAEYKILANADELANKYQFASNQLTEDDEQSIEHLLNQVQSALDALSPLEPRVSEITTLIDSSRIQVQEACALLRNLADNLDPDPARTDWLDRQLRSIQDLARKHRVEPPQLYACMIDLQGELATLESLDIEFDSIKAELADAESEYLKVAASLTKARANAAQKISVQITEAMQTLGMTGGRFEVNIAPLENEFSASGLERVEFLVCANPGQQPQPLTKVASGGELSRISLAIQVITAEQTSIPTLIYDEVDVGIGGKVAEIVGLRLRQLGILRQVLCITHLPQVAAQGNQHLSVSKINTNEAAAAKVSSLDQEARIKELSRMLGGVKITEQTKAHAKEMIEAASAQAI